MEKFKNPQDFRIFLKETQESLKNNNNYKNSNNDCMETTPIIFKIKSGRFQTNRNIQNKNVKNLRYLSMSSKKKQKILNIYGENLYNKSSVQTNINSLQSFGCPSLSKDETSLKIYDNSNSDHRKTRNYFEDRNRKLQLNEKNANAKLKDYINRNIYYIK